MVTAGVYLLVRMSPSSPVVLGTHDHRGHRRGDGLRRRHIATSQKDIKKVLAFSTVSQIGYMVLAVGRRGVRRGDLLDDQSRLLQALLFLGSGSVIHSLNGEQDMRKMGGLAKYLPLILPDVPHRMAHDLGYPALRRLLVQG